MKIPALSEAFIEKFKGVCCAGAQHQGQGVPPIHVVVAELTAPRVCLGDVMRGITNLNSGKIVLKGRGSERLEEDGCRGLSEGERMENIVHDFLTRTPPRTLEWRARGAKRRVNLNSSQCEMGGERPMLVASLLDVVANMARFARRALHTAINRMDVRIASAHQQDQRRLLQGPRK